MKKNRRSILVVAAHPDDEILGCGGTIARHARAGDSVHVLTIAEGVSSRGDQYDPGLWTKENALRMVNAKLANRVLGVKSLTMHDYPDNRLDSADLLDITKKIELLLKRVKPDTIYTHHSGDVNIDHRRVHDAAIAAVRPYPGQSVRTLLFFEVPSSTEWRPASSAPAFNPDWFVDISKSLDKKMKALAKYEKEMRPWPHSRSYEAVKYLAHWRGSTVGVNAAEAFVLGRNIIS